MINNDFKNNIPSFYCMPLPPRHWLSIYTTPVLSDPTIYEWIRYNIDGNMDRWHFYDAQWAYIFITSDVYSTGMGHRWAGVLLYYTIIAVKTQCLDGALWIPSSLLYKTHFSKQLHCWSLRCSWSIACRRCSNYIFILNLTPGFNGLGKDNYKMRREAFEFRDWVRLY